MFQLQIADGHLVTLYTYYSEQVTINDQPWKEAN